MKFKTTAIALAVAGIVAAPMAAQAEGSIYASARVGFVSTNTDDADTLTVTGVSPTTVTVTAAETDGLDQMQIQSMASRFGARGETDLGNGMTGFGRYEWDVDFDSSAGIKNRHRYVGVKGDFGEVLVGQTYHTFYNHSVGPLDNPWWGSGYSMVAYVGRTDNALTYKGGMGDITYGVTLNMVEDDEEEDIDIIEVGATFGVGDLGKVGVAYWAYQGDDDPTTVLVDEEEEIIGVTWSGIALGDITLGVGYQTRDEDDSVVIDVGFSNFYLHVESLSVDETDADPMTVVLGYTQSLGRNTTMWYEIQSTDNDENFSFNDNDNSGTISVGDTAEEAADFTVIRAILKYDIL